MSALCYIIAIVLCVLAAFRVHPALTLPMGVAFIAAGLLLSLPGIISKIREG